MKILHLNTGYGSLLKGSSKEIFALYKFFIRGKKTKKKFVKIFMDFVGKYNPDVIFLTEIKENDEIMVKLREKYPYCKFSSKYKDGKLEKKMRATRLNGNAFFSKTKPKFIEVIHLNKGRKSLVFKIVFEKAVFYSVHLSLRFSERKKQLNEISSIIKKKDNLEKVVITGDFNFFFGPKRELLKTKLNDFESKIQQPTFPSVKPSMILDNFLLSKKTSLKAEYFVLNEIISDHRAILMELKE